ncbi:DUF4190 domain-containing protein [Mycolicibacterium duvalii]|uniref:Septum formation-related domain-containing protein n=1 Tax=Mycolicibacterium duvalii TaxID=39688 RepID=A0A7I7K4H5_9MYCO|nr:DUF4190 domain-containing protein [Mycolicibacterium duvalii]BBX18975.1 hypothetical protein MDUV_38350 [Mycolicibacterium duvalii]
MTAPPPPPLPYQYGPAPGGPPPYRQAPRTNWWAIVSLVFGLIGGVVISLACGVVGLIKSKEYGRGRGMAIAGIVLSVVWMVGVGVAIVIFGVFGTSTGNVTATDVAEGDCLAEIPEGDRVLRVQTVDCAQPHAGEVFAVLMVPDGEFPGDAAIAAYSENCAPELESYAPSAVTDDSVQLYVLYPTEETWADGDRAVTCIATTDPPRAGSLRG